MKLRTFATPIIIGAFLTSAVTGVLLFFEVGRGNNRPAHEWVGLLTVAGAGLHITTNWAAFKLYFSRSRPASLAIVALFVAFLGTSFIQTRSEARQPSAPRLALDALSKAPLSTVALVANRPLDEVTASLTAAGFAVSNSTDSLEQVAGRERDSQARAFTAIFKKP